MGQVALEIMQALARPEAREQTVRMVQEVVAVVEEALAVGGERDLPQGERAEMAAQAVTDQTEQLSSSGSPNVARYALIKNSAVTNLISADSAFIDSLIQAGTIDSGIDLADYPNTMVEIGYSFSDGVFSLSLSVAKLQKLTQFRTDIMAYRDSFFDRDTREAFRTLRDLAIRDGLTNRLAYLDPLLDWAESIVAYSASVGAQIQAAVDQSALDAITWDIRTNTGAVPSVTLLAASQISD